MIYIRFPYRSGVWFSTDFENIERARDSFRRVLGRVGQTRRGLCYEITEANIDIQE
jgi:hypothetical protein